MSDSPTVISGLPVDTTRRRTILAVVVACVIGAIAHQTLPSLWRWFIEDAAISFSYARNLAAGDGLVPFPGGERIEGYSNPTWVGLLSLFYLVGVDAFVSAKYLALLFSALTVVLSWRIAREAIAEDEPEEWALLAPLFLALYSQFAIWNASGLENSLVNFLLALSVWRTLVESHRGGLPFGALSALLLAASRPEALLYAAVIGFWAMLAQWRAGRGVVPTLGWLGVFWAPFLAYHAVRYEYFAWPLPMTYYGKERFIRVWDYTTAVPWKYFRNWAQELWQGAFAPVYLIGLFGLDDQRRPWLIGAAVLASVFLINPELGILAPDLWALGLTALVAANPTWTRTGRAAAVGTVILTPPIVAFLIRVASAPDRSVAHAISTWPPLSPAAIAWLSGVLVIGLLWTSGWRRSAMGLLATYGLWRGLDLVKLPEWLELQGLAAARTVRQGLPAGLAPNIWANAAENSAFYRSLLFGALAVGGPLVMAVRPQRGWLVRGMAAHIGAVALYFSIHAGGDWMKGWRWYGFLSVPLALLLVAGGSEIGAWVRRFVARAQAAEAARYAPYGSAVVGVAVAALLISPNVTYTQKWLVKRETGPFAIQERVDYVQDVRDALQYDEPLVVWDVDQGAHIYWSGFWMMDMAGLIDVTVAQHNFPDRSWLREYFFQEMKPQFAHVHGQWARSAQIPTFPEWKADYFELPGYPAGPNQMHPGNFMRRDMLMAKTWPHEEPRTVKFSDGIEIVGWWMVAPEVAPARSLYLEIGVKSRKRSSAENFRVVAFIASPGAKASEGGPELIQVGEDGENEAPATKKGPIAVPVHPSTTGYAVTSWDIAMGRDWLKPDKWKTDEIYLGRYVLEIPRGVPLGKADLGFVVFDNNGNVIAPINEGLPAGAVIGGQDDLVTPAYAKGEVRFVGAVEVVTIGEAADLAKNDRVAAFEAAQADRCAEAEALWFSSRKRRPGQPKYVADYGPKLAAHLAACWSRAAKAAPSPEKAVAPLVRARRWDFREPTYLEVRGPVADALFEKGLAAKGQADWETAYQAFSDTLKVDPQRAWARRWAEEARDERLGLTGPPATRERPPKGPGEGPSFRLPNSRDEDGEEGDGGQGPEDP